MHFSDIIGHQSQKKVLLDSLSMGRIPHAQLFEGDDEQGVLAMAIAYANAVVCGDDSSESNTRLKANGLIHPDIHFVFPTATTAEVKSKPTSSEFSAPWRQFVQEQPYATLYDWSQFLGIENKQAAINVTDALAVMQKVSLKSFDGGWKCVVIWHAEKLTTAASNKLLKSIEEPPAKTLFLLVCPDENQLISTIRSRCQRTDFGRVSKQEVAQFMVEKGASQELANTLAAQSNGAVGKALSLYNQQENQERYEQWFVRWVRTAFRAKGNKGVVLELADWSQEIASEGVETQKQFLAFAIALFRAAVMDHYKLNQIAAFHAATDFNISKFAPFVHGGNIIPIVDAIEKSAYHLERNGNAQMIFTDLSFLLTRLLHQKAA
ncbi:MAG: ATP-binding protein [Flavobacteriaceae bacterium]